MLLGLVPACWGTSLMDTSCLEAPMVPVTASRHEVPRLVAVQDVAAGGLPTGTLLFVPGRMEVLAERGPCAAPVAASTVSVSVSGEGWLLGCGSATQVEGPGTYLHPVGPVPCFVQHAGPDGQVRSAVVSDPTVPLDLAAAQRSRAGLAANVNGEWRLLENEHVPYPRSTRPVRKIDGVEVERIFDPPAALGRRWSHPAVTP